MLKIEGSRNHIIKARRSAQQGRRIVAPEVADEGLVGGSVGWRQGARPLARWKVYDCSRLRAPTTISANSVFRTNHAWTSMGVRDFGAVGTVIQALFESCVDCLRQRERLATDGDARLRRKFVGPENEGGHIFPKARQASRDLSI